MFDEDIIKEIICDHYNMRSSSSNLEIDSIKYDQLEKKHHLFLVYFLYRPRYNTLDSRRNERIGFTVNLSLYNQKLRNKKLNTILE